MENNAPLSELPISTRLKEERERLDITQQQVADLTEVNIKTVRRWENESPIPSDKLALLDAFNLDVCFILTGKRGKNVLISDDEFSYIPLYDVEVSAGHGTFFDDVEEPIARMAFRKDWLHERGLIAEYLFCVYANGDSMSPTVEHKTMLLVNGAETKPKDGNIYIMRNSNSLFVKRLQLRLDGTMLLISDNKAYPDMTINLAEHADVKILGRLENISKDMF